MAVILKLIMLASPVVGVFLFLRFRLRQAADDNTLDVEIKQLKTKLMTICGIFFLSAITLYFITEKGAPGSCFISPRSVDGVIQPGRYVAENDILCLQERARKTPDTRKPAKGKPISKPSEKIDEKIDDEGGTAIPGS